MSNDQCYTEQEREQGLGSVVVVEPGKPAYTKQIAFTLESLQREVDGYIEAIYPFEEQVAIICNEEGKLDGRALNRALRDDAGHVYDVVAGTFLVVGVGKEDFTALTPELLEKFTEYFRIPETIVPDYGRTLIAPMTVYPNSAEYAKNHGEVDQYRLSSQANRVCKEAIEESIRAHHFYDHLDTKRAVREVVVRFGMERTCYVLACTIRGKLWDGRFSSENKAWAQTIPNTDDPNAAARWNVNSHPGLVNLFVDQARRELARETGNQKQEPEAAKKVTNKKTRRDRGR